MNRVMSRVNTFQKKKKRIFFCYFGVFFLRFETEISAKLRKNKNKKNITCLSNEPPHSDSLCSELEMKERRMNLKRKKKKSTQEKDKKYKITRNESKFMSNARYVYMCVRICFFFSNFFFFFPFLFFFFFSFYI